MFEDVGKKLTDFGQHMMKKTGEVAEIASLSTKVLTKKKKVQDEMKELGKAYYEAHKDEIHEFEANITRINDLFVEIEALEEEIKVLKEKLPEGMDSETMDSETMEEAQEETQEETQEEMQEEMQEDTVQEAPEETVQDAPEETAEEATEEIIEAMKEAADEAVEEVKEAAEEAVEEVKDTVSDAE